VKKRERQVHGSQSLTDVCVRVEVREKVSEEMGDRDVRVRRRGKLKQIFSPGVTLQQQQQLRLVCQPFVA
jgi:hypothetical protein